MRHIDLLEFNGYSVTLFYPEKTLLRQIHRSIGILMNDIRLLLPSRRIYQNVYYKKYLRTIPEKINDFLCDLIFDRPKDIKYFRHGIANFYNFMTFFDDANGQEVWNRDQIKERERSGQAMLSHREAQQEFKKAERYKDAKFMNKSKKLFTDKLVKVQQGYRYSDQFRDAEQFSQEALRRHLSDN